jgi:hypothetical protein
MIFLLCDVKLIITDSYDILIGSFFTIQCFIWKIVYHWAGIMSDTVRF